MTNFLVIHTRYNDVQIGLFRNLELIDSITDESKKVSKNFFYSIESIIQKHNISLGDISFIAANQGPAPFTTLRVCLASINGLAFATKLPLIGVNGLEVFLQEYTNKNITVALLNAFNKEVYYGISKPENKTISIGSGPAIDVIQNIANQYSTGQIEFIGNGITLYSNEINQYFNNRATLPDPLPESVSLRYLAKEALKKWANKDDHKTSLMPIYLKESSAKLTIHIQSSC